MKSKNLSFNEKVYILCKQIPKGKVSTYKEIAHALSCKGYQAVGNALHKNPYAPVVPCHRVVNTDGKIGGFAWGSEKKIAILKEEGIFVKDEKILDFEKRLFVFSDEIY